MAHYDREAAGGGSLALSVTFGISVSVPSTQHGRRAEQGQRRCCWPPRSACRLWLCCANILEVEPWKLLCSSKGRGLLFCLTLTGCMNNTRPLLLSPPGFLCYPTPTPPGHGLSGPGHCNFSPLSYSLSLCVRSHKHTQSIHPSCVNTPTKSLAADGDHPLFCPAPSGANASQIQDRLAMTSCLVTGGNQTGWDVTPLWVKSVYLLLSDNPFPFFLHSWYLTASLVWLRFPSLATRGHNKPTLSNKTHLHLLVICNCLFYLRAIKEN